MQLETKEDGWHLIFLNGIVQLVKIDFRLGLVLSDGDDQAQLLIGTSCRLMGPGIDAVIDPEDTASTCPALKLFNKKVEDMDIRKSGHLVVNIGGEYLIKVSPSDSYEAWEIGCSIGFSMVCAPGGTVSLYRRGEHRIK
jgi:hypothetical protein